MKHTRIRTFNTKDTYPEQNLDNDLCQAVVAGGVVYSFGIVFFAWQNLRFQSAIWHGFVVAGAGLHLAAVTDLLVITRL